jgi:hypothetical protein
MEMENMEDDGKPMFAMENTAAMKEQSIPGMVEHHNNTEANDKPTNVTQPTGSSTKDDCSDLTDNNNDPEEQAPKSFPQKVSIVKSNTTRCVSLHHSAVCMPSQRQAKAVADSWNYVETVPRSTEP